jgi:hypothetical protein
MARRLRPLEGNLECATTSTSRRLAKAPQSFQSCLENNDSPGSVLPICCLRNYVSVVPQSPRRVRPASPHLITARDQSCSIATGMWTAAFANVVVRRRCVSSPPSDVLREQLSQGLVTILGTVIANHRFIRSKLRAAPVPVDLGFAYPKRHSPPGRNLYDRRWGKRGLDSFASLGRRLNALYHHRYEH